MVFPSPFPRVPVNDEALHDKLLRAVWTHAVAHPSRAAFVLASNPNKYVTYGEVYTQVHSVAAFLKTRGFKQGEVAALVLHNSIEWPIFNLGTWAAGGAISGASALFTDFELERQFLDSQCSVVFTDEAHIDKVVHAAKNCTRIHTIICVRADGSHRHLPGNIIDWAEVIGCRPQFDTAKVSASSMAVLPYSSGTTGSPKGVMLSHRNFGTMVDIIKDHFERQVMPKLSVANFDWYKETLVLNLPFYHIFGFGLLTFNILAGITGVVMEKFEPVTYLKAIARHRPRLLFVVPPILIFLAKAPVVKEHDFSSVEMVFAGAAPLGKDICDEFLKVHNNVRYLTQGYGMTECGMASHLPLLAKKDDYNGVGVIISNFDQKIVDPTGKELGMGEKGELCVRGPSIMMGYLNRPEATAETVDKEGWLHTGDIGYYDETGRTYIVDRLKELIKVKGLQVPPAELEDLLLSHPLVSDCAVIGLPDKKRGELVRAYVVRSKDSLTESDIIQFVAHKVSEYKHITGGVRFVKEIPKSAAGKILRRIIKEDAASEDKGLKSKL